MLKTIILFILLLLLNIINIISVNDSLNFVIHSGTQSCMLWYLLILLIKYIIYQILLIIYYNILGFYEHFNAKESRTVDAFVQSGSGSYLLISGPLNIDEIRTVLLYISYYLLYIIYHLLFIIYFI